MSVRNEPVSKYFSVRTIDRRSPFSLDPEVVSWLENSVVVCVVL